MAKRGTGRDNPCVEGGTLRFCWTLLSPKHTSICHLPAFTCTLTEKEGRLGQNGIFITVGAELGEHGFYLRPESGSPPGLSTLPHVPPQAGRPRGGARGLLLPVNMWPSRDWGAQGARLHVPASPSELGVAGSGARSEC